MKTKEQKNAMDQLGKLADKVDIKKTNEALEGTSVGTFKISKRVLTNIAEWCLNGDSEHEIAHKLELNKNQWNILISVCPKVLEIMENGYAFADLVVGGSLLQVAIGGKKVKKTQIVKVGKYENGIKVGEEIKTVEYEEELPPNPLLLKYLAENRFTEKMSDKRTNTINYDEIIDSMDEKDIKEAKAMIEATKDVSN